MVHNESPGYRVHGRVSLHHDHAVGLLEIVNHVVEYRHEILQVQHQTRPTSDTLDETDGVVTRVLLSLSLSAEGQLACSHALVPDTAERWDATRCVATQLLSLSLSLWAELGLAFTCPISPPHLPALCHPRDRNPN
jgi:hypothetical protein